MGTSNSKKKKKEEKVSCLVKSLHKFLRKGTFHLETQREDSLAYEMLRQDVYEREDPLKVPIFDLALFLSMSMECGKLLQLHSAIAELDKDSSAMAVKEFQVTVLKSTYRYSTGKLGGFSTLVTFAILSRRPFVCAMQDSQTQNISQIIFGTSACWMTDSKVQKDSDDDEQEDDEADIRRYEVRLKKESYNHIKGTEFKCEPLDSGICDHYKKWLTYARTFRSSMELPPKGNTLAAAAGLIMEFEGE